MRCSVLLAATFCVLAAEFSFTQGASTPLTIEQATKFCEAEVPKYCMSTTCPQICEAIRSPKAKANCKASECTTSNRCKLFPTVTADEAKSANQPLITQNREQLWACIAQKRDPNNVKTGRPDKPWKEIRTNSFISATRP